MKTAEHMTVVEGLIRRIVELEAKMLHEHQSALQASRKVVELEDKIEAQQTRIQALQQEYYIPQTERQEYYIPQAERLASIACFLNNLESCKVEAEVHGGTIYTKIGLIKAVKVMFGYSLKECKDFVETNIGAS